MYVKVWLFSKASQINQVSQISFHKISIIYSV